MKHSGRSGRRLSALAVFGIAVACFGAALAIGALVANALRQPAPVQPVVASPTSAPFALPEEAAAAETSESAKRLGDVLAGSTVLRVGDQGLPVKFVAQRLNMAGIAVAEHETYDTALAAAVLRLQEKFGLTESGRVNKNTLETLLRITERGPALPEQCRAPGTVLCIDKTQKVVRLVVDGTTETTLDARFGSFGTATDEGSFTVYDKRADDWSTAFGVPMQYSMYFSGGQAVHYSQHFADDGYTGASHGCVNTRDLEATAAMFDRVAEGTPVYVYQ